MVLVAGGAIHLPSSLLTALSLVFKISRLFSLSELFLRNSSFMEISLDSKPLLGELVESLHSDDERFVWVPAYKDMLELKAKSILTFSCNKRECRYASIIA
ncbi:hypothetical protein EVAR_65668_1 [Eumeta japonica]|uniref:Uncharacterized protein n=1 Tax=Eumeta variegata TaxID=151549 RepID=A0A4C2A3S6_EUMVA|nr:hypothetical protein EVAR_65668_1 [Eumeta japonica]